VKKNQLPISQRKGGEIRGKRLKVIKLSLTKILIRGKNK